MLLPRPSRPILERLGQIWWLEGCRPRQGGDSAGQLEDAPFGKCIPSIAEGLRMQW